MLFDHGLVRICGPWIGQMAWFGNLVHLNNIITNQYCLSLLLPGAGPKCLQAVLWLRGPWRRTVFAPFSLDHITRPNNRTDQVQESYDVISSLWRHPLKNWIRTDYRLAHWTLWMLTYVSRSTRNSNCSALFSGGSDQISEYFFFKFFYARKYIFPYLVILAHGEWKWRSVPWVPGGQVGQMWWFHLQRRRCVLEQLQWHGERTIWSWELREFSSRWWRCRQQQRSCLHVRVFSFFGPIEPTKVAVGWFETWTDVSRWPKPPHVTTRYNRK